MEAISIRSRFLSLILVATAFVLLPPSIYAQFCPTPLELDVVVLINQERIAAGLQPVGVDVRLVEAARLHSVDMATNDFVGHDGSNGSSFSQRIVAAGYPTPRSENVAAGFTTAASVVQGWMDSPGHRANILDSSARHIGIGQAFESGSTYGTYWTNDFGSATGAPEFPGSCSGVEAILSRPRCLLPGL